MERHCPAKRKVSLCLPKKQHSTCPLSWNKLVLMRKPGDASNSSAIRFPIRLSKQSMTKATSKFTSASSIPRLSGTATTFSALSAKKATLQGFSGVIETVYCNISMKNSIRFISMQGVNQDACKHEGMLPWRNEN